MPSGDWFSTGAAPMQDPFSSYMNPRTMTQRQSYQPQWGNVGYQSGGDPFGPNEGDISGKGWRNPLDIMAQQTEEIYAKMAQQQQQQAGPTGSTGTLSTKGATPYDDMFVRAAAEMSAKYGVSLDPALLKAMGHIESGGTFNNALTRDDGFGDGLSVGIMQVKPNLWGNLVPGANAYDPEGNIRIGAALMAQSIAKYGTWQAALTNVYFPVDDPNGTTQQMYIDQATKYMQLYAGGGAPAGGGGNASSVVQVATSFVGKVPYVWGGIPGKGANPTGWDCSGFTYWLDQNYGSGDLPAGSHYQYQYAQQTGRLRQGGQPQVGDLVFFNTGFTAGGGSNLNGASHVGMYIGGDQFVHAANSQDGTTISSFSQYVQNYGQQNYLGAMAMSWSGGGAYSAPMQGGAAGYGSGSLMGNWNALMDPNAPWRTYTR